MIAPKKAVNFALSETAEEFRNISRTILRDETYRLLKKAIITGKIAQGEKVTIRKISAVTDLSLTPIREALLKLEQDGIVIRSTAGHFFTRRFSQKEIKQIFSLRILLEAYSAAEVIKNVTEEDISLLEQNVIESKKALKQGLINKVSELNMEFHDHLNAISHDEILQELQQRIADKVWINTSAALWAPGMATRSLTQHEKIIEALKAKDLELVTQLLKEHVVSALEILDSNSQ